MKLSTNEEDILKRIVGYGGYVTKEILHLYKKDLSMDRCYRILLQLEHKGYIRKRDYFESFRQPDVYQVTKKACSYFERPEAYMRKKHKENGMRRYLIRAHFLFSLAGANIDISLFSSASRKQHLNDMDISDYYLPKKRNKDVETVQIEEYILDAEPYSKKHTICLLYIDNQSHFIKAQLEHLLDRYKKLTHSGKCFVDFLVITESERRAQLFRENYEKYCFEKISMVDLKAQSIERNYRSTVE